VKDFAAGDDTVDEHLPAMEQDGDVADVYAGSAGERHLDAGGEGWHHAGTAEAGGESATLLLPDLSDGEERFSGERTARARPHVSSPGGASRAG
jgi:hypothetical protein